MQIDTKEFELPDTHYIRDIDSAVFQGVVLQCLSRVKGIGLIDGTLLDTLLGLGSDESVRGIVVIQDTQNHSVSVKVEINVAYGVVIPQKAEEIHTLLSQEITRLTGLHVASVHVVFKNLISHEPQEPVYTPQHAAEERYSARFV